MSTRVPSLFEHDITGRRKHWLKELKEKGEEVLRRLDENLKKDRSFMTIAARGRWHALRYAAEELRSDRDFVLKARIPCHVGGIMSLPFRVDEAWLRTACGDDDAYDPRFHAQFADEEGCLTKIQLLQIIPQMATSKAEKVKILRELREDPNWLSVAAEDVRADPNFMAKALDTLAKSYKLLPDQTAEAAKYTTFGALNVSLAEKAALLVDGDWLMFYASGTGPEKRVKPLPRRQDLPEAAIYRGPLYDLTVVLTLSYCWASPEHPDPDGTQLIEVARIVECMSRIHAGKKVLVFWDWAAFPQHAPDFSPCEVVLDPSPKAVEVDEDLVKIREGHHLFENVKGGKVHHVPRSFIKESVEKDKSILKWDGSFKDDTAIHARIPRDEAEEALLKKCLRDIDVWFANRLTVKVCLTYLPEAVQGTRPEYQDSGWPTFESIIARSISDDYHIFDLKFLKGEDLSSISDLEILAGRCGVNDKFLPMSPTEFNDILSTKTFSNRKDFEFIKSKYQSTYDEVVRPRDIFEYPKMSEKVQLAQWVKFVQHVLPDCRSLMRLDLHDNPKCCNLDVANFAEPKVANALAHLNELILGNTAVYGDINSFSCLRRLRKLDLNGLDRLSGDILSFSRLIEMRELIISGCWRLVGDISTLKRMQELTVLDIEGCKGLRGRKFKDQLQELGNILPLCTIYYTGSTKEPTFVMSRFHVVDLLHQQQRPVLEYEHNKHLSTNNHRGELDGICVIASAEKFACIEHDSHIVSIYSAREGEVVKRINAGAAPMGLCHIPEVDGSPLLACCANSTMVRFNNMHRDIVQKSVWTTPDTQMCLCWQPLQNLLYSGSTGGKLYTWDIHKGEERACYDDHTDIIMKLLSIHHLGNIVTASLDSTINVWDSFTGNRTCTLRGHTKGVNCLAFNPGHRFLISSGFDHDALIWSPFDSKLLHRLKGHRCALIGCHAVEGTSELITADVSGLFKLWDLRSPDKAVQTFTSDHEPGDLDDLTGKLNCFAHIEMHKRGNIKGGKFDGYRIIAGSKKVLFFDQPRAPDKPISAEKPIRAVLYNPESLTIFTASERNVTIWDANLGSKKHYFGNITQSDITAACLEGMMTKFVIGEERGEVSIHDYQSGRKLAQFTGPSDGAKKMSVVDLRYIPSPNSVLVGYLNGSLRIYDISSLSLSFEFKTESIYRDLPKLNMLCMDYVKMESQSGLVASIGLNRGDILFLWDVDIGRLEMKIKMGDYKINAMTFLDPYPLLAIASSDHRIRIWGVRQSKYKGDCVASWSNQLPANAMLTDDLKEAVIPDSQQSDSFVSMEEGEILSERERTDNSLELSNDDLYEAERKRRSLHPPPNHVSTAVSELSWDPISECLFTGDEAGHLRKWDLKQVLAAIMNSVISARDNLMYILARQSIEEGRDLMSLAEVEQLMTTPEICKATSSLVNFVWGLEMAHDETIKCSKLITEPRGIITASEDLCVRLWTLGGDSMGELQMDTRTGKRSPGWELKGLGATEKTSDSTKMKKIDKAEEQTDPAVHKINDRDSHRVIASEVDYEESTLHDRALNAVMAVQQMEVANEKAIEIKGRVSLDTEDSNSEFTFVGDPTFRKKKRSLPPEANAIEDPLRCAPIPITKLGSGLEDRFVAKQKAKGDSLSSYLDKIASKSEAPSSQLKATRSAFNLHEVQEVDIEPSLVPPSPRRRETVSREALNSIERLNAQLDDAEDSQGSNLFEGRRSNMDDFRAKRLETFKASLRNNDADLADTER